MVDSVPDLHTLDTGQFFPRYVYDVDPAAGMLPGLDDAERHDNITDTALAKYRSLYGADVTADDVFYAVYGLLHSPDYREQFAADLKKMLPRIPDLADPADFRAFADAGRALSTLHLEYETAAPYAVKVTGPIPAELRVTKMRFAGKAGAWDRSTIRVTDALTISGIPEEAHEYMLGSRSAIEWILERYQVKTDSKSLIVNDPNLWGIEHGNSHYILDLLMRVITVSVETVRIVKALPELRISQG